MLSSDETLVFALDAETRQLRHVREGETGLDCNRICPGCGERLEAVNARSLVYKKRPHFRHLEGQDRRHCAMASLKAAVVEALTDAGSISLPAPITPGTGLFGDQKMEHEKLTFTSALVDDFTDAVLTLPDGRELRIWVEARDTRAVDEDGLFDLILFVPPSQLAELKSLGDLRRYLTLDTSAWRWCRRQTRPSLLEEPKPTMITIPPATLAPSAPTLQPPPIKAWSPPPIVVPTHPPVQQADPASRGAIKQPELRFNEKDGSVTIFHRWLWPSGTMTETIERIPPKR